MADETATPPTASAIAPDCRHYRGDRPCIHNRLCNGCSHYAPYSHRICIIKLGALGDVIRTLCLLPELRRLFPQAHITWVSLPNGCRMIARHPMIDRVMPFDATTNLALSHETFDTVISLDKEPGPCALAASLSAKQKLGIGWSQYGTPIPLNAEAEPYFHLGLSDELKFKKNTKSYPQLVYEALGLTYGQQRYELPLDEDAAELARGTLERQGWTAQRPTLGVNVGAGKAFANKMWPAERTTELVRMLLLDRPEIQVLLLGGPDERATLDQIYDATSNLGGIFNSGHDHDEPGFVAMVNVCDALFTGDTMAMHVAVALGKGVVAFFGPTCEQEIDLFGRGEKLVAKVACSPCYKRNCDRGNVCIDAVSVDDAAAAVGRVLDRVASRGVSLPVLQTVASLQAA